MTQGNSRAEFDEVVRIDCAGTMIEGEFVLPRKVTAVVLFAHGSGSSRHSPRNLFVAGRLHARQIGTLLVDLLTPAEDVTYANRFDIALLTERLGYAARWLAAEPRCAGLPLGLFGASTGAASALRLAALAPGTIAAVVSRGGRPDLAGAVALRAVVAPTLLIVGGRDGEVIDLNEAACAELRSEKHLAIVPGATHLFEEPGTLEQAAELAADWFSRYLTANAR